MNTRKGLSHIWQCFSYLSELKKNMHELSWWLFELCTSKIGQPMSSPSGTTFLPCFCLFSKCQYGIQISCIFLQPLDCKVCSTAKTFRIICEGEMWFVCTVTFRQKSPKFNISPVSYSQLHGSCLVFLFLTEVACSHGGPRQGITTTLWKLPFYGKVVTQY